MKLGFTQVYNEVNWIGFAIDQAMKLCDELFVCEGSHFVNYPDIPERSNDGTLDIIADKKRQYSGRIKTMNTIRIHENYRHNQCANFNIALSHCKVGDYFIPLDADMYYMNDYISWMNNLMAQEAFNVLVVKSIRFAYSFYWQFIIRRDVYGPILFRKTPKLKFIPTHRAKNVGGRIVTSDKHLLFHYTWVKPRARIKIRMRTSGFYRGMLEWFDKSWDNIELIDGESCKCWNNMTLTLKRYDGKHPEILDDHPWRHVEDVRRLEKWA